MISVKDTDSQIDGDKQSLRGLELVGPLFPEQEHDGDDDNDEDDDIHLYTRVRILGVSFRINQLASLNSRLRERQIMISHKDWEDVSHLIHRLAEDLHLSEKDCRAVISRFFAQQIPSTTQSAGFSEKMMMTPEVLFGQDSTQKLSEKVGSESPQNQVHQVLSLPEPYSNILSSDETKLVRRGDVQMCQN